MGHAIYDPGQEDRPAWNVGRKLGAKRPLLPKQVWAVRFFLEPLSDGSLPAYDIQKDLMASLAKLPVNKDTLVASGIGKVIMFYIKSKKPELTIKRQAERLFTDWTRPILRRTDDYRKKEFAQADYDPRYDLLLHT